MDNKDIHQIKFLLVLLSLGVWGQFVQHYGIVGGPQEVHQEEAVRVYGTVDVDDIDDYVNIGHTVDINISQINGKRNVFYQDRDGAYILLPVLSR